MRVMKWSMIALAVAAGTSQLAMASAQDESTFRTKMRPPDRLPHTCHPTNAPGLTSCGNTLTLMAGF